jgi:transposase-like protein
MVEPRKKKRWKSEEVVAVLRRVLLDKAEVSRVCEETGCCPSQVYRWQKQLFDQSGMVFERSNGSADKRVKELAAKAEALEAKLRRKDEVLSELMEEHVAPRKALGRTEQPLGAARHERRDRGLPGAFSRPTLVRRLTPPGVNRWSEKTGLPNVRDS